jgi:hypothetical protein
MLAEFEKITVTQTLGKLSFSYSGNEQSQK